MKLYKQLFLFSLLIGSQFTTVQVAEKTYIETGLVYRSEVKGAGVGALAEFFLEQRNQFFATSKLFFPARI